MHDGVSVVFAHCLDVFTRRMRLLQLLPDKILRGGGIPEVLLRSGFPGLKRDFSWLLSAPGLSNRFFL